MPNLSKEEVLDYQNQVTLFAQLLVTWDESPIQRYLEQTRGLADGTMDPILPHFMNMQEMKLGKRNLQFLRAMGRHILEARATSQSYLDTQREEAARYA